MASVVSIVTDAQLPYSVVFEDDGRVAYAYLRDEVGIVGDVWLYNSGPTPDEPEWGDRTKLPFANPKGFTSDETPPTVLRASDVSVRWIMDERVLKYAEVMINGKVYGRLAPGAKPGWARLASRQGPLALPLHAPPPRK